jgi:hypothetical protein
MLQASEDGNMDFNQLLLNKVEFTQNAHAFVQKVRE